MFRFSSPNSSESTQDHCTPRACHFILRQFQLNKSIARYNSNWRHVLHSIASRPSPHLSIHPGHPKRLRLLIIASMHKWGFPPPLYNNTFNSSHHDPVVLSSWAGSHVERPTRALSSTSFTCDRASMPTGSHHSQFRYGLQALLVNNVSLLV